MFEFNGQKLDVCLGDVQENCFSLAWNELDISMSVFFPTLATFYLCLSFILPGSYLYGKSVFKSPRS